MLPSWSSFRGGEFASALLIAFQSFNLCEPLLVSETLRWCRVLAIAFDRGDAPTSSDFGRWPPGGIAPPRSTIFAIALGEALSVV